MKKKERHKRDIAGLFSELLEAGDSERLTGYLVANSDLPGPRANLELAAAFGDVVEGYPEQESLWELCSSMSDISADEAPVNAPREFLPFCGAIGIGAIGSVSSRRFEEALTALRRLAMDRRWRMREGVCFGLQRLMASRSQDTVKVLERWVSEGAPLEMRAVAATVAEPGLLQQTETAHSALQLHRMLVDRVLETPERKSEEFRTLRKALGYTLSVVVQALPEEGFELMALLATSDDPDVLWIVKQNLKKNRLVKHFPDQVEAINRALA